MRPHGKNVEERQEEAGVATHLKEKDNVEWVAQVTYSARRQALFPKESWTTGYNLSLIIHCGALYVQSQGMGSSMSDMRWKC